MPEISIIILTYNSAKHLNKLFDSLFKVFDRDIKDKKIEVVLVDNNSDDETIKLARKIGESKVKIVENRENKGFSAGINRGVEEASGKYLVFMNPDAEFVSGDIYKTVSLLDNDKVGVVGGRIINTKGESEKSTGRFINTFETGFLVVGMDEAIGIRKSPKKNAEVDFVSGGFMFVKKDLFESIGGFDEDYFMYIEDMDLCYRIKKKGYKILFTPEISIMHAGQGSSNKNFAFKHIFRGLVFFQKKHGNRLSQFAVKSMLQTKAATLVMLGRMMNNRYLTESYSDIEL